MELKDFLLKVGDYIRIQLNVYHPDKEDIQDVVKFQQRMCDVMPYDGRFSQELRDKVESLMEYSVEYIGTELQGRLFPEDKNTVPVIALDITKDQ